MNMSKVPKFNNFIGTYSYYGTYIPTYQFFFWIQNLLGSPVISKTAT